MFVLYLAKSGNNFAMTLEHTVKT